MALKKPTKPHELTAVELAELSATLPEIVQITPEEYRELGEARAQLWLGISLDEFIRRYRAGEYDLTEDHVTELSFHVPVIDGQW
jgi:hypothetical protein